MATVAFVPDRKPDPDQCPLFLFGRQLRWVNSERAAADKRKTPETAQAVTQVNQLRRIVELNPHRGSTVRVAADDTRVSGPGRVARGSI